ncbi:helix-turn-helix domain-containing protein [Streptomyces sp. MMG1121]|uniref:helix-turn-helix domain-containing protein n=1 Tax=Streptomyces sp. MMG1121 TaxID=1415544 RepID=UPI0006AE9889|nr:XRE family transcriptional regulator [Streptomyces sp. MMG1121]KOV67197.1 hypothetical protein ADK64_10180 [Streptomyces sp. MMG1121]
MPRWKDLPEDLDPQITEFTSQIRRLVDRSGLSVAALADRTGYSRTSWERYLSGRLLAPKGAVVALAEVTGTNPVHLTTMWELAERAWSRAEMRHDRTMEAIRISQARAALGDFGAAEATGGPPGRRDGSTKATPPPTGISTGIAGPAGVSPTIPPQPTGQDADVRDGGRRGPGEGAGRGPAEGGVGGPVDGAGRGPAGGAGAAFGGDAGNSWGLAGYQGPSQVNAPPGSGAREGAGAGSGSGAGGAGAADGSASGPGAPDAYDAQAPRPAGAGGGRQRLTMFLAGLVGMLVVIAAVFFFTQRDHGRQQGAATRPSSAATRHPSPPPGVKCAGSACDGKDAEAMGCSGDLVTTAKTATVGATTLEVRYSKACGTAWGRITGARQGDKVQVLAGTARQTGEITAAGDAIAYTPMVAVKDAAQAKACATLAAGRTGCTK